MIGKLSRKRRGISGLMQVAMIVGIVIIFAGILFTFAGDIFDVQTIADSISLQKISIQNLGDAAYLSVNVKNTGNGDITSLEVSVQVDTESSTTGVQPFNTTLSPSPLTPGMTGSAYARLVDSDDDDISLANGDEIAVVVEAITVDGSIITEPVTVRVR